MTSSLRITPLDLPEIQLIEPVFYMDERGWFGEVYQQRLFAKAGIQSSFVQDNQFYSEQPYTLRGLHYQIAPFEQAKLIRVLRGRALVVALDIRKGSASFGRHVARDISAMGGEQLYIPVGFADGICSLEAQTEILCRVDGFYDPAAERGINWRDPALGIKWPVPLGKAVISPRDVDWPMLAEQSDLL
jgi:dTDP-4-dehydrorhamnose 3,5-epimerase